MLTDEAPGLRASLILFAHLYLLYRSNDLPFFSQVSTNSLADLDLHQELVLSGSCISSVNWTTLFAAGQPQVRAYTPMNPQIQIRRHCRATL